MIRLSSPRLVPAKKHRIPGAQAGRVLQNCLDARNGWGASDQGSNRVESRNRCVPRDIPEALVAPPAGTRTTDFAVLLAAANRHGLNTNDL
jgi:hypothetical protein